VKKQLSALFAAAVLAVLAACGSTPTAPATAASASALADDAPQQGLPQDTTTTTQRVPNMMGSGN
jgi:ABC-type glycerol-3-phosphate transport system substrate-binding protein